jgi:hypothetical protein
MIHWVKRAERIRISDYGIIFDHLVPSTETNPEVLQLNVFEKGDQESRKIPLDQYSDENVVVLPRCCQVRVGSTDRRRVNSQVQDCGGCEE